MPRASVWISVASMIALASGCAEQAPLAPAAKSPSGAVATEAAGDEGKVQAEAAPPSDSDSRFSQDVPAEPPPRPVRQIDRSEGGKGPEETGTGTATLGRLRPLDTTMGGGGSAAGAGPSPAAEAPHDAAMLVYTAHLTMAVYQVAPAIDSIEDIGRSFGGYLSSRNDTQIVIRVPRARFDAALHKIETTGDVLHRDVSAEDVTDQYVDLDARLRNARAVRDRLEELLQKAAVKEAIEIQRELERVTGEIETLEGKLKLLKDRVAYSVIGVTFQARGEAAVREKPLRLPFPWLGQLGLPHLLDLGGQ